MELTPTCLSIEHPIFGFERSNIKLRTSLIGSYTPTWHLLLTERQSKQTNWPIWQLLTLTTKVDLAGHTVTILSNKEAALYWCSCYTVLTSKVGTFDALGNKTTLKCVLHCMCAAPFVNYWAHSSLPFMTANLSLCFLKKKAVKNLEQNVNLILLKFFGLCTYLSYNIWLWTSSKFL